MSDYHTPEEVALMAEFMGYKGAPRWIFMGALNEWKLNSQQVLANAKVWEARGKPKPVHKKGSASVEEEK